MPASLHILGVRHHGPGSARMVARALEALRPDAILIEGPPDADDVLPLAADVAMKPPVALLVYEPDTPANAAYYPFAEFSPEWQAIRWGLSHSVPVRFIDLPFSLRSEASSKGDDAESPSTAQNDPPRDPLDALALAAGFQDGESWWGRLIEERRGDENPLDVFAAIHTAMAAAREHLGEAEPRHPHRHADNPVREAHMRRAIRAAMKEGFATIAVVCGAWHAPVLTNEHIASTPAKRDDDLLRALPKRKTTATWIPWTNDRLALASGYGAGVESPGWYEHLWIHHTRLSEHWLTKVARLLRSHDLEGSPASIIEAVRLAETLASLRGRSIAGLDELGEATLAILCHGNPLPLHLIHDKLIVGSRLGEVPDSVPSVPLQRDLAALQKSLRLKVTADSAELDLDQRKPTDLARSHLLHRLQILGIQWGTLLDDQRQRTSTFHELWTLQWKPELTVAVIEAARWGNTVEQAAAARAVDRATSATALAELTTLLDHVMLADLPGAVHRLISRITDLAAVGAELASLMDALPPLARILRYGNVRQTDAALVAPVVAGMVERICVGLLPASVSLDDDAATALRGRIDAVHAALATLARPDLSAPWLGALARVAAADVHGLVAGRACRILLDADAPVEPGQDSPVTLFTLALSRGNDPAKASAWLDGFLSGSGIVLLHDERLLAVIDAWVSSLPHETFELICPIARRTFSTFEPAERRQIGEKLKRTQPHAGPAPIGTTAAVTSPLTPEIDAARASLVDPVLALILGEVSP